MTLRPVAVWVAAAVGVFALASSALGATDPATRDLERRVTNLLRSTPLVDGHIDLLAHYLTDDQSGWKAAGSYDIGRRTRGQVDLPRLRAGQVSAGIFTVGILDTLDREAGIHESTALLRELTARHRGVFTVVTDAGGLVRAFRSGRVAALMGLEGGEQIGRSLDALRAAHGHGVRAMTLTWEHTNEICDSNADTARWGGLSPFGAEVVEEMNRLGMLVDLSHASDATAHDVLDVARAPVIFSHSSARVLCPATRNVPDDLLRRMAANGGIVMVCFVPAYTRGDFLAWYQRGESRWGELEHLYGERSRGARRAMSAWEREHPRPRVTLRDVADHVEHVRAVAGVDHVGLGSDFDGMFSWVEGLEDASDFPALFVELARRGWSDADLRKLAGENFLRVLREVEEARDAP